MKKNFVLALLAIPLVVFSTYSLKAQEVFSPYEGSDSAGLLDEFGHEDALKQRLARINWDLLNSAYQRVSEGGDSELTLNLFPDESFSIVVNAIRQHEFQEDKTLLMGSSTEGDFSYMTNSGRGQPFIFFQRPEEFTHYLVSEVKDGVSQVFKFPWGSLFSQYRGGLTPDEPQISGKHYRLVHVNHEEIFSKLENFSNGEEADLFFGLLSNNDSGGGAVMRAYIKSVTHTPAEDYKITLGLSLGPPNSQNSQDDTFELNIAAGKVTSMEIIYTWVTSRRRYEVIPFDEAEGVYIMTEEVIENFGNN